MPDTIIAATAADPGRVLVQPAPPTPRLALRGDPALLGTALGLEMPGVCRAVESGARAVLWLGPDEFLLLGPAPALEAEGTASVDIGHRQLGLVLDGPGVEDVLAAGCPLDLHRSRFPVGSCTRTVFGKAEIVLWRQGPDRFHLEVWRSFAAYVQGLLAAAASAERHTA